MSTHVIVDPLAASLSRLHLVDASHHQVYQLVTDLSLEAINVVASRHSSEGFRLSELSIPLVVGQKNKLREVARRAGQMLGVVVESLTDCCMSGFVLR